MSVTRSTVYRFTAVLLPLLFLWLCAACVSICRQEAAAAADHAVAYSSAETAAVGGTPECDGCPFVSFPKAASAERVTFTAGLQTSAAAASLGLTADAAALRPAPTPQRRPPPPATPPLELLSTLRV